MGCRLYLAIQLRREQPGSIMGLFSKFFRRRRKGLPHRELLAEMSKELEESRDRSKAKKL